MVWSTPGELHKENRADRLNPLVCPAMRENGRGVLTTTGVLLPKEKLEYRAARDALILRLFLAGNSYRAIGRHPRVNLSPKGVGNVVNRQLAEGTTTQLSRHGAALYVERLEMMLRVAWPKALAGDMKAVALCLRVLKQEAKLYGIDDGAPDEPELDEFGLNALEQFRQRR